MIPQPRDIFWSYVRGLLERYALGCIGLGLCFILLGAIYILAYGGAF